MLVNKYNKVLFIVAAIIIFLLFNLLFFIIPFVHTLTFWVGYGFTVLGTISAMVLSGILLRSSRTMKIVYRDAEIRAFVFYILIQFCAGLLWAALSQVPHQYPAIVNLVAIALFALYIIRIEIAARIVENMEGLNKEGRNAMENRLAILKEAQEKAASDNVRTVIKGLLFDLESSDPKVPEEAKEYDEKLDAAIQKIKELINCGDEQAAVEQCSVTTLVLKERNRKIMQCK